MTPIATTPAKCATCAQLAATPLACTDCHTLLEHVQGADYFELFGLPRRFAIDDAALQRHYLAISRNVHPDGFATAEPEMQALALRLAAAVNRAYAVVKDPMLRAEYLLETSGGKSAADDKRVPPQLLGEVMMLREEIEEARLNGDAATLARIRESVLAERTACERRVAELAGQLTAPGDETRDRLRLELNAMKYYQNLLAQL